MDFVRSVARDAFGMYWTLVKVTLPVLLVTRLALDFGIVEAMAPAWAPVLSALHLPPELGFAAMTGLLVGVWGGAVALFAFVPIDRLTTADVTVFMSMLLVAHALPIEQRIIRRAGVGFVVTSLLRLAGGLAFAWILAALYRATGWLAAPAAPHWAPAGAEPSLAAFAADTVRALVSMLAIIVALVMTLRICELAGLVSKLTILLAPLLGRIGIGAAAAPTVIVGLTLGLSYGGALIIEQARQGRIAPRELVLAVVFMGFAHSMIEDTALAVAIGADFVSVFFGRLIFAVAATALIACALARIPERVFRRFIFVGALRAVSAQGRALGAR